MKNKQRLKNIHQKNKKKANDVKASSASEFSMKNSLTNF